MPKQRNFIARLFGRKEPKPNPCQDICVDGSWWRQEMKDGICVPVGGPFGRCGEDFNEPGTGIARNAAKNSDNADLLEKGCRAEDREDVV